MRSYSMGIMGLALTASFVAAGGPNRPFPAPAPTDTDGAAGVEIAGEAPTRVIQLAICLDTSGSMSGLIDAAKQKLWAIVNDLALVEPTPRFEVALLTYGNDGHNAEDGWVAVGTPFTGNLDLVSQQLFALSTNGGTEFVGRVLRHAGQLQWHPSDDALKLIVIAGNESADQDQEVPFREVCKALISKGVMVNAIYCGPIEDNLAPDWKQVALLADGKFATIDQNKGTIVIVTPFDEQLGVLGATLNTTYLAYGAQGGWNASNQVIQDHNAASLNSAAVAQRASTKGGVLYGCSEWDLVDACKNETFKLEDVKVEDLPEPMKKMTPEERKTHIGAMGKKRAEIQAEIAEMAKKRQAFVQEEVKRLALDDSKSFDNAIRRAVREQAKSRGFSYRSES